MDWPRSIRALLKGERFDSCIDANERVVFFPTVACRISAGMWRIPIHGWIYQPSELSRIRRMGLHLVKRLLRLQVKRSDPQMKVFRERMGAMLADNERGERIRITLGETVFTLKRSRANGHFHGTLELPDQQVATMLTSPAANADWLTFRAVTQSNDPRIFDGRVMLLAGKASR